MIKFSARLAVLSAVLFAAPVLFAQSNCQTRRAVFDIGSGTTKIKVADVNTCARTYVVLVEKEEKVDFGDDLSRSADGNFSQDVMDKGLEAVKSLHRIAQNLAPQAYSGVATAAFRSAKNAKQFLDKVEAETSVTVKIISQDEEARLGFSAATAEASVKASNAVVWDIGGSSMQIMTEEGGKLIVFKSTFSSVAAKNYVVKVVQNKTAGVTTPNPMSPVDAKSAVERAEAAAGEIDGIIAKKIASGADVIGIGGVHNSSIPRSIGAGRSYTKSQVSDALAKCTGKTDEEIGGKYAATEVSNLALVLGFMNKLNCAKVVTANVSLANGILLDASYW